MLRWPDARTVDQAVRHWAQNIARQHPEVIRLGYFGSYARGNAGVGSDLDVIVIVDEAPKPFRQRALSWDATELPVPTEILIYTVAEWQALQGRFRQTVESEAVWVYARGGNP